jgi:protein tyrosine phosphatase (PTP) superfamily phosphohydrolase (DUF442 family)
MRIQELRLVTLTLLTAVVVCGGCSLDSGSSKTPIDQGQQPAAEVRSTAPNEGLTGGPAFAAAAKEALPRVAPGEYEGLRNVFALSANIITGSEPTSAGLEVLKKLGVRTIISVESRVPDADTARSLGMRYVHLPIQYKTITDEEVARLTKTFRECEAPFFLHCFHGKHRGPAAAAIGRRALDGVNPARAIAEMRQWAGTAPDYEGLYKAVLTKEIPSAAATRALAFDFPAADLPQGIAAWMSRIERMNDALRKMAAHEWRVDPRHPDLTPLEAARNLAELTAADWCQGDAPMSAGMSALKNDAIRASEALVNILATGDNASKSTAHKTLLESCTACHKAYRNN